MNEGMLSPADVAVLSGNCGNGSNGGYGFGDNGAWWIILFLIFGWGRNGFGGYGNNDGGSYGAKEDAMKALDYMMKSVVQFIQMLEEDASSQEEIQLIKKYTKKISEM